VLLEKLILILLLSNDEFCSLSRHAKNPFFDGSVTLRSTPVFSMASKTAQEKQSLIQNIVLYCPDLLMSSNAGQVVHILLPYYPSRIRRMLPSQALGESCDFQTWLSLAEALLDTVRVLSATTITRSAIEAADKATRNLVAKYKALALSIESGTHCPPGSAKTLRSIKFPKLHGT
jgi:hypothetical protein